MRNLRISRRTVALDRLEEYAAAWGVVRLTAAAENMRAWVFRRQGHDDQFIEFVEWTEPALWDEAGAVAEAVQALDACGVASDAARWEEASLS